MKISLSTIVAFVCCNLKGVLSTPSIDTSHDTHVQCLGSINHESDSCSVSAIFPPHEDPIERHTRKKRQFINNDLPSSCYSSNGRYGICLPYHQCYSYFKMSAMLQYQNVFMRAQDSCTYPTSADVQEMGVCCTNDDQFIDPSGGSPYPDNTYPLNPDIPEEMPLNELPTFQDPLQPVNWPPPLPTHPPLVQWPPPIPTRPTYPPGPDKPTPPPPIYPPGIKPTTKPPYKPPSTKPPYKPPATQHPPWVKPTTRPPMTRPPMTRPPMTRPPMTRPTTRPTTKPPLTYPTTESEVEDINYSDCGIKNGKQDQERIVGGKNTDPGEWPWMAAIMIDGKLFCGGSLIDSIHILTAAHCVAHMSPWDIAKMKIHLGDHDIKTKADGEHVERRVMKVVRHAGFDPHTLYNDIAVLTLDAPVQFSRNIRPICLPAGRLGYSQRTATVIGWGSLKEMGPTPSILQEVNVKIWENQDCRRKYGPAAPGGIIDSFLCAGDIFKDSCSGDSGGPLMVNDGKWQQVGIVSWGIGCGKGQFPGVYTRMTSYMTWLYKNLHL